MPRINLFFETLQDSSIEEHIKNYKIIRLKAGVQFKTENGWSRPYSAIIDTGAHTSVVPLSIWKNLVHENFAGYKMFGVSRKEECAVQVNIGKVKCVIVDEFGNQTDELDCTSFLAKTDKVPLLIGFKDILEKLSLVSNFDKDIAYIEET